MAFSKLKAFLKKTAARTVDDLWNAIAEGIETFSPFEKAERSFVGAPRMKPLCNYSTHPLKGAAVADRRAILK